MVSVLNVRYLAVNGSHACVRHRPRLSSREVPRVGDATGCAPSSAPSSGTARSSSSTTASTDATADVAREHGVRARVAHAQPRQGRRAADRNGGGRRGLRRRAHRRRRRAAPGARGARAARGRRADPSALVLGVRDLDGAGAPEGESASPTGSRTSSSRGSPARAWRDTQCGLRRYPIAGDALARVPRRWVRLRGRGDPPRARRRECPSCRSRRRLSIRPKKSGSRTSTACATPRASWAPSCGRWPTFTCFERAAPVVTCATRESDVVRGARHKNKLIALGLVVIAAPLVAHFTVAATTGMWLPPSRRRRDDGRARRDPLRRPRLLDACARACARRTSRARPSSSASATCACFGDRMNDGRGLRSGAASSTSSRSRSRATLIMDISRVRTGTSRTTCPRRGARELAAAAQALRPIRTRHSMPTYQRVVFLHSVYDISLSFEHSPLIGCSAFALGPPWTKDGHVLVGRAFDMEIGDVFDTDKVVYLRARGRPHPLRERRRGRGSRACSRG